MNMSVRSTLLTCLLFAVEALIVSPVHAQNFNSDADTSRAKNSVEQFNSSTDAGELRGGGIHDAYNRVGYIVRVRRDSARNYGDSFNADERFEEYQKGNIVNLIKDIARQYDIEVESMTSWTSAGFAAFLTEEQLNDLRNDVRVELVVPDQRVNLSADSTAVWNDSQVTAAAPPNSLWAAVVTQATEVQGWGKRAVNQSTAISNGTSLVYVVDSGIGQHEDLNVVEWVNTNNSSAYHCGVRPSISCTAAIMPYVVGCYTHGTAVAGIIGAKANGKGIVGTDPGVAIVSVNFSTPSLSAANACNNSDVVASKVANALNWIMADITMHPSAKLRVVNLSSNGYTFPAVVSGDMLALAKPTAGYPGAFVVESAGNDFSNACAYGYNQPSVTDGIMVIGAINNHGQPVVPLNGAPGFWKDAIDSSAHIVHEPGSNYGPCVDAWAPGDAIYTTMAPVNAQRSDTLYHTYGYGSGTSFSAPHVAGLAAYLIETIALTTPALVEQNIRGHFSNLGSRAPTNSAFPPSSTSFHDNGAGLPINLPTLNPVASPNPRNTPYAEFVISSACLSPKFISSTPPAGCRTLDYYNNSSLDFEFPFAYYGSGTAYGQVVGMAANRSTLTSPSGSHIWLAFDSYGTLPYTCDVTTTISPISGSTVVHSGAKYYYDAGTTIYEDLIYSTACGSAAVNNFH